MKTKILIVIFFTLAVMLMAANVVNQVMADPVILYVDVNNECNDNLPCYPHPQDAVNAASPGDTVLVYPGTYGSRYFICNPDHPNWCQPHDNWAPALIVYKDDLTIKAIAPDPAETIIESTHNYWSNAVAVQNSTAGAIIGINGWSPNAITVVANNVTIEGFTIHRPYEGTFATWNTAGVFIGSNAAGSANYLGYANEATVTGNVFSDVWHAVYIWHSSGNQIVNNIVAALGSTGHWAAISTFDGFDDAQIILGPASENNRIANNNIFDKGISLGAWAPDTWTSNAGSQVCGNNTFRVGIAYTHGPVIIGCNTGDFWHFNTDNVLRVTGITNTGDTGSFSVGTAINLSAQLGYNGSADGSGVEVIFTLNGTDFAVATTVAGGSANTTVTNLPVGVHEVQARVTLCGDCVFTSNIQSIVVYDPAAGSVTGSGWIWSPAESCHISAICGNTTGKGAFSLSTRYLPSSSVPSGVTTFEINAGGFRFKSDDYAWLVVDPFSRTAQFMGSGKVNGNFAPNGTPFKFTVYVYDGIQRLEDTFQIVIWYEDEGSQVLVYDNGPDQQIGGGNITIHN